MSNRHQELASPKQTASGKDFSNSLMADSLPKTIWDPTSGIRACVETLNKKNSIVSNISTLKPDIIVNGDLQEEAAPTGDQFGPSILPVPKTAKQLAAKRNQE
ncbi:hypothetical protein Tco_0057943 [Tanacetum coccineum]